MINIKLNIFDICMEAIDVLILEAIKDKGI